MSEATNVELTETQSTEVQEKKKSKYTEAELMAIFDTIMFEGSYSEDILIKGKLKVSFKSMAAKDVSSVSSTLDSKQYVMYSTLQEQRALLNLSKSLMFYNQKDISGMDSDKRLDFISNLPAAIVSALSDSLIEFSTKVQEACEVGQENF